MDGLEKIVMAKGRRFLLRVEDSEDSYDYKKYEDLRQEIWEFPEDHMSSLRNLLCENFLHEGSSLFIGAFAETGEGGFRFDGEHLAAFSYGFVGIRDKTVGFREPSNLRFYSQYTGAKPGYQGCGLGILIKEFQREILLSAYGIDNVICTFDPLTAVNASRNIHHFGMEVLEYRVATYGEYGGKLNRPDIPTDRFFMSWDLRKPVLRPGYDPDRVLEEAGRVFSVAHEEVRGKTGALFLEVVKESRLDASQGFVAVQIPADFYTMLRETDVEEEAVRRIPRDWRFRTRPAFQELFAGGYEIFDFMKKSGPPAAAFYMLRKRIPG